MCVRMQWSAILMFLSVCRVWALPLAAVGRLRVGERQRCCGDPVCVVPPAHGTLWPPADLGRHGAPHLQHIPWLLSMLLSFLFDFLTKYLIVLHFKNRKLGIVIHSCWENGKREDYAILNCMPNKDHQISASHFDQINAKMQLDFVPCLVALSHVWKLQSHAFYKKYITGPVIKTADITTWFDSHAAQWDIPCQTAVSFDRDDGGRLCLGLSGWSQRKAERSGRLSGSEWHIWGGGQFGPEVLALFAPAVLQWSRVTSCQKSFYIHRDILKV